MLEFHRSGKITLAGASRAAAVATVLGIVV
jgi:hypothetical protein